MLRTVQQRCWLLLAGAVFLLSSCTSADRGQSAALRATGTRARTAAAGAAGDALPIEQAAARLDEVLRFWEVQSVETTPRVVVGGTAGYRVMLRHEWQDWVGGGQSGIGAQPVTRRNYVEFVLFPLAGAKPPPGVKARIQWRTRCRGEHTRRVCLGSGFGYLWLADAPLYLQHVAREGLGLVGGDDPLQLLADGLFVRDRGKITRNSVMPLLSGCGDRALPYLERAIARATDDDVWVPVSVVGQIPGEQSTRMLAALFESSNETRREVAARALTRDPHSELGKRAYFELLRNQWCPQMAAAACADHGWSDALPLLDEVFKRPRSHHALRSALEASRRLRGEAVPDDLRAAEATLGRLLSGMPTTRPTAAESDAALAAILSSPDVEYAVVVAIDLALYGGKGGWPVRDVGRELLRALPPLASRRLLQFLAAGAADLGDRLEIEELIAALGQRP